MSVGWVSVFEDRLSRTCRLKQLVGRGRGFVGRKPEVTDDRVCVYLTEAWHCHRSLTITAIKPRQVWLAYNSTHTHTHLQWEVYKCVCVPETAPGSKTLKYRLMLLLLRSVDVDCASVAESTGEVLLMFAHRWPGEVKGHQAPQPAERAKVRRMRCFAWSSLISVSNNSSAALNPSRVTLRLQDRFVLYD